MKKRLTLGVALLIFTLSNICSYAAQKSVTISTIEELIAYAQRDNVNVTMKSGEYHIDDPKMGKVLEINSYKATGASGEVQEPTKRKVSTILHFSGNNSTYNLDGVVIKLGGEPRAQTTTSTGFDLFVSGNNNVIIGLAIEDKSSVATTGTDAVMAHVMGDDNILDGVRLYVEGSDPYGYGHLLGKGYPSGFAPLHKRSSMLISGRNTKLLNCTVITRAYGHGIFMQGAVNTYLENCYVEGKMRTTDHMLAETKGVAYEAGFKSIYPPGIFEPNRMMALSEDGIRTYPYGGFVGRSTEGVTVVNCTVKNMRSGIDLGVHIPPTIITGCTMIECQEKGYAIGSQAVVLNSRGDAKYGPLLTFQRNDVENCYVELELIPTESTYKVTRLAEINGKGHIIKLSNADSEGRKSSLPIVFGESFWSDVHTFRFPDNDPSEFSGAYDVTLINETGMPVEFKALSGDNRVQTNGAVVEDLGTNNKVEMLSKYVEVYNLGVAGNTSADLVERVDRDVVALRADLTIVMVGTNDMLNSRKVVSYDDYEKNLTTLIEKVKATGSQVMLLSAIPADSHYLFERHDKSKYAGHPSEVMAAARDIVQELSLRFDCYFVDLFGEFTSRGLPLHNEDIYIRNEKNSRVKDGVHPTAAGYQLIGETIWEFIERNNLQTQYKRIVCFGDSITKGSGADGAGGVNGKNYPSYLNQKFNE
ncbi:MAG: GDSL-type esterase/lipase family protein [Rikenellaceae bacterium]